MDQFETFIDNKFLKRRVDYFENGAVVDFKETLSGEYEAIILGDKE